MPAERVGLVVRALGSLPVRLLAGLECDELDRQPNLLRPVERGPGGLGELVLPAPSERVLELVTRERLDLREVTLGSEAEVRLALLVLLQLLVDGTEPVPRSLAATPPGRSRCSRPASSSSVEAENVARLELVLGRELVHALLAGPPPRHDEVVEVAVR